MNIKRLLVLIVLLIMVIMLLVYIYEKDPKNYGRHLYDNNKYAHFSKITAQNIIIHPKYLFAHPQKFILNAGDALIIPKGTWHWVLSDKNTFGVNYWYD